ncbi:hypothetical protein JCGZ_20970 [Jatropha curcas]|uniref:DUF1771 domain-containing protein n=1 Tax=Jatropha curcas TaxID=180498 RepID=A0A067K453_JATCU|nr:putative nuclear RNA export factor SDE5 isoform X2 [Jatropha curcas]KDP27035.1 hypothetical protein JCGZ_20970 [Jatropha curcas]
MEAISTAAPYVDEDLEKLVEFFGSTFSVEDVASAFCEAGRDSNLAAEILCGVHGTNSNALPLKCPSGLDSARSVSSELPSDKYLEKVSDGQKRTKELGSKKYSASMGTVSSVIGKEYTKPRPKTNEYIEAKKPLMLESKDFPVSMIWSEDNTPNVTTRNCPPKADIEEFLFKMLGDGSQIDMPVIQQVLGLCGYDVQKSIDKLLDLSASTLENCEGVGVAADNSTGKCSEQESVSLRERVQHLDSDRRDGGELKASNLTSSPKGEMDRTGLQKEVLQALFDVPNRSEEAPKFARPRRFMPGKRLKAFGKLVTERHKDATREHKPSAAEQHIVSEEEDADNNYEVLRAAVKEYLITMKEYYKAAVDAFVKGDHARAHKLQEQGQFFKEKAREADDRSCQKLVETRNEEVMCVELHDNEPKESLRLLRLHLTSLSGIPSIKYLRLKLESNNEDAMKGKRKRLILKQLEKESIKWNEEGDGETILIQVDVINPKSLSFAKKQGAGDQSKRRSYTGYL